MSEGSQENESSRVLWIRAIRVILVVVMYGLLFLPWWNTQGTDLAGPHCPPECPPANGLMMWLAAAGWLACVPIIPLLALLPTAVVASRQGSVRARAFYWITLTFWLIVMVIFSLMNVAGFSSGPRYITPYLGLALALISVLTEGIVILSMTHATRRFGRIDKGGH